MRFKDWLQKETMTSTSCIAGFSRPMLPVVRRNPKKNTKALQLQVKETVTGHRGVGPAEIRQAAQGAYTSPTMRSGSVYFDTGPDAHSTAVSYVNQGGGGDPKLGAKQIQGKGYVMGIAAPDGVAHRPDFKADTGHDVTGNDTYQAVPQMQPGYISTVQSVRPNPQGPMKLGDMTIQRPPVLGKPRDAAQFFDRYKRMFGQQGQQPQSTAL